MPTYAHKTALSVNDKTCIIHLAIVVLHYNDNMSRHIKYHLFCYALYPNEETIK